MVLHDLDPRPDDPEPTDPVAFRGAFRQVFRRHASTVVVVTHLDANGAPRGMTATSMVGLSADPPSLLVCIDRATRTHEEVMRVRSFGIDLLSVHQRRIGVHCAQRGTEKWLRPAWLATDLPLTSSPRLARSVAHVDCTIETALDAFTHTIVVGRIRAVWLNPEMPDPLLYHDGVYAKLAPRQDLGAYGFSLLSSIGDFDPFE